MRGYAGDVHEQVICHFVCFFARQYTQRESEKGKRRGRESGCGVPVGDMMLGGERSLALRLLCGREGLSDTLAETWKLTARAGGRGLGKGGERGVGILWRMSPTTPT